MSEKVLFNSLSFAIFLPLVFAAYWSLSGRYRVQNALLLAASYVFYGWWDWRYLGLIAGCSLVNFLSGRFIYEAKSPFVRRLWLVLCCVVSLGALAVFKYFNFFIQSFADVCSCLGLNFSPLVLNIALPVGISFFTFQALSYTFDIASGRLTPCKDWCEFFAFIAFFPQLVAGPIERAANLLPQFSRPRRFSFDAATHGVCLMAYGLFKKIVVADTLSQYVDNLWLDPVQFGPVACVVGAVFFAVQIYCDFSGYSDVARGTARLFGFELMINFNSPYLSDSFSGFWRRWHISLSSWFRDYVYIPLGGSRAGFAAAVRNIWIVFLLSGLWHGASWAFILWGAIHAVYLTLGAVKTRIFGRQTATNFIGRLFSILVVDLGVVFAWIFFRAGTIENAAKYLGVLFRKPWNTSLMAWCAGLGPMNLGYCILAIAIFSLTALCPKDCQFATIRARWLFTLACAALIVFLGMPSGGEFIYFRF